MVAERWFMPRIDKILKYLNGGEYFSSIVLFSGYWQIRMEEAYKDKTTFICRYGTFKFEDMPFGLINAPATFQHMMDTLLKNLDFVRLYIDDIVIHSRTEHDHSVHLRETSKLIAAH